MRLSVGILAGGKSTRMGKNKAWLPYQGESFIETIAKQCSGFSEILISVDEKEKYKTLPFPLIEDEKKEYGPLEGIYQLLRHAREPYLLALATDMPLVQQDFLYAFANKMDEQADCLVLKAGGRVQPLCSIYSRSILPILEQMRREEEHRLRMLFDRVSVTYVNLEELNFEQSIISNVNDLVQYRQICETKEDISDEADN